MTVLYMGFYRDVERILFVGSFCPFVIGYFSVYFVYLFSLNPFLGEPSLILPVSGPEPYNCKTFFTFKRTFTFFFCLHVSL